MNLPLHTLSDLTLANALRTACPGISYEPLLNEAATRIEHLHLLLHPNAARDCAEAENARLRGALREGAVVLAREQQTNERWARFHSSCPTQKHRTAMAAVCEAAENARETLTHAFAQMNDAQSRHLLGQLGVALDALVKVRKSEAHHAVAEDAPSSGASDHE